MDYLHTKRQKVEIGLEITNDDPEEKIDKKENFLEAVQE